MKNYRDQEPGVRSPERRNQYSKFGPKYLLNQSIPIRLSSYKFRKYSFLFLVSCLFILLTFIPLRVAIAFYQAPRPQAILTLGGGPEREQFTAQFAQAYPSLQIWVSSGAPTKKAFKIFQSAGIPAERVHLDQRAVDTVTNFTSLVGDFQKLNIQHLYLITADYHMPRSQLIGTLVLGSRGIVFTPVAIASNQPQESWFHILRDGGRAIVWLITGRTGASLNPNRYQPLTN